ncbi:MAG: type III PLP-dependent enzyme [Dehalococcoidia bacterium]|nr:type III PLP-dependent enzyme [Dehalococcoidia bacterium]
MQPLLQLAAQHARRKTPFLLLDSAILCQRAQEFLAFSERCSTFYAVKANAAPKLLKLLHELGLGFEVSSEPELKLLLALNVPPERIITSNPIKAHGFIKAMAALGARRFVFDSQVEAQKLARLAPGSQVLVRLAVDNSGSAWPLADKYGVDLDTAPRLLAYARSLGLVPAGVAFHVGSQCTSLESWQNALERASRLWSLARDDGIQLRLLNIGGGFPAHHQEAVPSVAEIFAFVFERVARLFPPGVQLEAEPGRALVADAGVLVTSVIGKAVRPEGPWLYLDAGVFNGLTEAVGGIRYRFTANTNHAAPVPWTIAGPTCDSFDVVAKGVLLPEPALGARVFIYPAGAYTTVYASTFNGTTVPRVLLV